MQKSGSSAAIPGKAALMQEWQKAFGSPPPMGCHSSFLAKALAWQAQARKHGGLTAAERRQLLGSPAAGRKGAGLGIGSRLVRVWQGETHQVTVTPDGYEYDGKQWKSLSAIARAITGTPWSGPVFFGIKK